MPAGNFSFKNVAPGNYEIQVSSVGYATLDKVLSLEDQTANVNYQLADEAVQLEGIIVSAQKKEELEQKFLEYLCHFIQ